MVDAKTTAAVAMTCRGSGVLQFQVIVVGLDMRNVNLAAALTNDLWILDHLGRLNVMLLMLSLMVHRGCILIVHITL